jgi:hypothetical protein
VPDLLADADTGSSSSDNVTRFDNSGTDARLRFEVPGTVPGATVTLLVNGVEIGTATAAGATTVVTTNGSVALPDGARAVVARQTEPGKAPSASSAALAITIDTSRPVGDVVDVSPDPRKTGVDSATVTFSRPVTGFDFSDVRFTLNGAPLATADALSAPTTSDNLTWTIPNIARYTEAPGDVPPVRRGERHRRRARRQSAERRPVGRVGERQRPPRRRHAGGQPRAGAARRRS